MTSPTWQHRSFLTSLPITRTINIYSWTRHHWENPRTQGWGWSTPPAPQRLKTDYVRRVREVATQWPHPPPPGQHDTAPRGLPWAYSSSSRKREPREDIQLLQHCESVHGILYSGCALQHLCGICRAWPMGIWLRWRRGKGLTTTRTWILADHFHTWSVQVVVTNRSFAPMQSQEVSSIWPSNSAGCLIQALKGRTFLALEPDLSPPRKASWVTVWFTVKGSF